MSFSAYGYLPARHHHPVAGTKLYCLVIETPVCINIPAQSWTRQRVSRDFNQGPVDRKFTP